MPWGSLLTIAQQALGWSPSEFWAATVYEMETALLARLREIEPEPMTEAATVDFFDRLADMGMAARA